MRQDVCNNLNPEERSAWKEMPASLCVKINQKIPASPTPEPPRQAHQHQTTREGLLVIDTLDHPTTESGITESAVGDCTAEASLQLHMTAGKTKPLCSKLGGAHPSALLSDPKKHIHDNTGKSVGCINAKFHACVMTNDGADSVVHKTPTHWVSERHV